MVPDTPTTVTSRATQAVSPIPSFNVSGRRQKSLTSNTILLCMPPTLSALLYRCVPESRSRRVICDDAVPQGLARTSHLGFGTFTLYDRDQAGDEDADTSSIPVPISITSSLRVGPPGEPPSVRMTSTRMATAMVPTAPVVSIPASTVSLRLGSNGSSTVADLVGGILWAAEAEFTATGKARHKGSVVSMSLGGDMSQSLNDAVKKAVESGMHFAASENMEVH